MRGKYRENFGVTLPNLGKRIWRDETIPPQNTFSIPKNWKDLE